MELATVHTALSKRFGEHRVSYLPSGEEDFIDILKIDLEIRQAVTVLMTIGMSEYKMPVSEAFEGREYNEICFCLPSYWDFAEKENPIFNWPYKLLQKLAKNVIEKQTWYAPGHTISNGKPPRPISEKLKQEDFIITEPILLEDLLQPIKIEGKTIHFLTIIPVFKEELHRKADLGYKRWVVKFRAKNGNEIVDHFRTPVLKKRWFLRR